MKKTRPVSAYVFSVLIAIVAVIITIKNLSQLDYSNYLNSFIIGEYLVILFIGLPLLLISCFLAVKGSGRGNLIWLGVLSYFIYTYSKLAFGTLYNQYYLFNILLFSLSFFAFIRGLVALDIETFGLRFSTKLPVKLYAFFLVLAGIGLAWGWLKDLIPALVAGSQPSFLQSPGTDSLAKTVLDLGIVVPLAVTAGLWIWKRKAFGYILTGFLLLNGLTMRLIFLANKWIIFINGEMVQFEQVFGHAVLTLIILVLLIMYLKHFREEEIQSYHNLISAV